MNKTKNKKSGFTLAEVLITLSILGVIAVITVPSVINSFKKKQTEIKIVKAYSLLEEVLERVKVENRWANYNTMLNEAYLQGTDGRMLNYFGENYLKPYLNYSSVCQTGTSGGNCGTVAQNKIYKLDGTHTAQMGDKRENWYRINLKNGSQIGIIRHLSTMSNDELRFFVDTNGIKAPNRLGYDVFYFSITDTSRLQYCSKRDYIYCYPGDRLYASTGSEYGEKRNNCEGDGVWCISPIRRNGWKIPDNYPVKWF